jgi:hypothetical protein
MAIGAVLALALGRFAKALPRVPEGDLVAVAERAAGAVQGLGEGMQKIDGRLREWPVAGLWLLAVAALLGALGWAS